MDTDNSPRTRSGADLLTTEQAAIAYSLSPSTLRKWRCTGEGPRFTRIGRAVRYRRSELDVFVEGSRLEWTDGFLHPGF